MPTESTFFLAGLFLLLAAAGWALGRFGERDEGQYVPPPTGEESTALEPGTSPGWLFLLVSSALGMSAALAMWHRL